jgi:two-component system, chemotaxis family, response regulator Rcp1
VARDVADRGAFVLTVSPESGGAGEIPSTRTPVILLVEDSVADVRLMQEVLRETGLPHQLVVAGDGERALRVLRGEGDYSGQRAPDLVLLDLNLPGMDGRQVLRTIKQDPALRRTPVLILSTSTAESDIIASYEAHANCYLSKPVDLSDFFRLAEAIRDFWLRLVILPPKVGPNSRPAG